MWITTMENASRLPQRLTHIRAYDLLSSSHSVLAYMVCRWSLTWLFIMLGKVRITGDVLANFCCPFLRVLTLPG